MGKIIDEINDLFELKCVDANSYSPLSLAYIGDSIFDLVVKSVIVERGNCPVNKLHIRTANIVKAVNQAKIFDYLKDGHLSEEEENIMRRGRNAKPSTKAKNASFKEYCKATGVEALVGYLYLLGRTDRVVEIVKLAMDFSEAQ